MKQVFCHMRICTTIPGNLDEAGMRVKESVPSGLKTQAGAGH